MCESSFCSGFLQLLLTCEQRVSGHKKVDPSYRDLSKNEIDVILGYFQLCPQRQCMCCYRDLKNFDRFNFVIRSLNLLDCIKAQGYQNTYKLNKIKGCSQNKAVISNVSHLRV